MWRINKEGPNPPQIITLIVSTGDADGDVGQPDERHRDESEVVEVGEREDEAADPEEGRPDQGREEMDQLMKAGRGNKRGSLWQILRSEPH